MPSYEVVSRNFLFMTQDLDEAERVLHEQIGKSYQDPSRPDVSLITDGSEVKTFSHEVPEEMIPVIKENESQP